MKYPNQFQMGLRLMFTSLCALALIQSAFAQTHRPSPRPAVAPLIGERYANDADGDRVDDVLLVRARKAEADERAAATAEQKSQARAKFDELVNVELIFKEPVTQRQIDTFTALGGEITYLYKAVSYGWNARIPLNKISAVPAAMGASFVLLDGPHPVRGDMDEATANTRVRATWVSGFAGNVAGFNGTTNITIAFSDSGLDETHTDLAGRSVYAVNFTDENSPATVDPLGHGSHVAGIALGTGAAGGLAGPMYFTMFDDNYRYGTNVLASGGYLYPIHLPGGTATFSATARWLGGASTTFSRYSRNNGDTNPSNWSAGQTTSGFSPLTLSQTTAFNISRAFSPSVITVNGPGVSNYVVTAVVSNYSALDSFNRLRGVAPGCNWAAAKTIRSDNTGEASWVSAALDDLVDKRVEKKIKVINMSQTVHEVGGINVSLRQKVNSAVMNGIVVVTGTGNNGKSATDYQTHDPARAALALTMCAVNDINQLTDYSSAGFSSPDSTAGQEEDYKPDLMAPGGSGYYSYITSVDSNNGDGPAFTDQQPNDYTSGKGTSFAVPFGSGCAGLVIEAMERNGTQWDFNSSNHPRFVKMVLCATASESNTNRETNFKNPSLQRAASITNGSEVLPPGKDIYEGYGNLNADAAVEAVSLTYTNGTLSTATLGPSTSDRRVWARTVNLFTGRNFSVMLTNPATGDFDLYLYSATPSAYGTPVLLASNTQAGNGVNETLNYTAGVNESAFLVVKRVSGSGAFGLIGNVAPAVDFVADITNGLAPLAVNFTNFTAGDATNYLWSFGDGNTSILKDASNTYLTAGTYSVELTAVGPGGTNAVTKLGLILVTNLALPVVDFAANPTRGFAPLTVSFTNQTTGATNYDWNFGDGDSTTEKEATHTYTEPGSYTVELSAAGPGGTNSLLQANYIIVYSLPQFLAPTVSDDEFTFSFETMAGFNYTVEFKNSLDDPTWQTLQVLPGDGSAHTITNLLSVAPQRFFRLRLE